MLAGKFPHLTCHTAVGIGHMKLLINSNLKDTTQIPANSNDGVWIFGGRNAKGVAKDYLYQLKFSEGH